MDEDEETQWDLLSNKLKDLGYPGGLVGESSTFEGSGAGKALSWLTQSILSSRDGLGGLGDVPPLPATPSVEDSYSFAASLGVPLFVGPTATPGDRVALVLNALASELQCLRLALSKRLREAKAAEDIARSASLETELHSLLRALSIPPVRGDFAATHPDKVLAQVKAKLEPMVSRLPEGFFDKRPLLDASHASPDALQLLRDINEALREDYSGRRSMLLQRLDVTVQSFLWSDKVKGREEEVLAAVSHKRRGLVAAPTAIVAEDAFAAGEELKELHSRKVTDGSSAGLRSSSVKNVVIGDVPDRGGRVAEMKLKSDMPAWQQRKEEKKKAAAAAASGGGGGGGGGKGGGAAPAPNSKDARVSALLKEASKYEGEAGAALKEHEEDMAMEAEGGGEGGREGWRRGRGKPLLLLRGVEGVVVVGGGTPPPLETRKLGGLLGSLGVGVGVGGVRGEGGEGVTMAVRGAGGGSSSREKVVKIIILSLLYKK